MCLRETMPEFQWQAEASKDEEGRCEVRCDVPFLRTRVLAQRVSNAEFQPENPLWWSLDRLRRNRVGRMEGLALKVARGIAQRLQPVSFE